MYSAEFWQRWFQELIDHIPRAEGEYEGERKQRIARRMGIGRSTLYEILEGKCTKLASVDGVLSALAMIPAVHDDVRLGLTRSLFQIYGYQVESRDGERVDLTDQDPIRDPDSSDTGNGRAET